MHTLSDFRNYWLPSFSSFNGPASLAYLVQQLVLLGVRPYQVRLFPCFGHVAAREVISYYEHHRETPHGRATRSVEISGEDVYANLLVNVRPDNRLRAFFPLLCVGLLPDSDCTLMRRGSDPAPTWHALYQRRWEAQVHASTLTGETQDPSASLDTPNTAGEFFESWLEQLLNRFPELNIDSDNPYEVPTPPSGTVLQYAPSLRESALESLEWDMWRSQTRTIRELMQWFLTHAFILIGCVDLLIGKEYRYFIHESVSPSSERGVRVAPQRLVGIPINSQVTERALCQWLRAVPHYLIAPLHREEPSDAPRASESPQATMPPRWVKRPTFARVSEPIRPELPQEETPAPLLTPEHPDILALVKVLRERASEKGADLNIAEILPAIRRYLPYYIPLIPTQSRVIGGVQLLTLLVKHLRNCWTHGFIGVEPSELALFEASELEVLEALVILRRVVADPFRLFQAAARLMLGSDVRVEFVPYQPIVCVLGSNAAALSKTLVISERPRIHQPCVVVVLPLDRTQQPDAAQRVHQKLEVLRKLFIPAHYDLTVQWQVDWARLGETAHLSYVEQTRTPTCRLQHLVPANVHEV